MPEPITTVGLGAIAAYLGKDGLQKLLGPTADYLGGELQEFTQKRIENVGRIFRKAEKKLGEEIEQPGKVSPKVLKTVINDGSYCEDDVAIDYFGGILASSRNGIVKDDRGARIGSVLDGMSIYQIHSHYLIYSLIKKVFHESGYLFNMDDRPKMRIFISIENFIASMKLGENEVKQFTVLLDHSLYGLEKDYLIQSFKYGPADYIKKFFPKAKSDGILVTPSASGAELYLWGYGKGNEDLSYALNVDKLHDLPDFPLSLEGVESASE